MTLDFPERRRGKQTRKELSGDAQSLRAEAERPLGCAQPVPESLKPIQWITTRPSPYSPTTGYDAGQKGWKLHAVRADPEETFNECRWRRAACGLLPRWGWGLDAFIDDRCSKCEVALLGSKCA